MLFLHYQDLIETLVEIMNPSKKKTLRSCRMDTAPRKKSLASGVECSMAKKHIHQM
jgi:hypothetical protein